MSASSVRVSRLEKVAKLAKQLAESCKSGTDDDHYWQAYDVYFKVELDKALKRLEETCRAPQ